MVDEYQDVNPSQELLIRQMRQRATSLFVVGDDDQAIYAWRGADVSNIIDFQARYPNCSAHTLSHNFRSTPAIVQAADHLISSELGPARITKNPTADAPTGPRDLRRLWFDTRPQEADWVAARIAALLGTAYAERDGTLRGLTPGDFAILMRSTRGEEQIGPPRHAAFTDALNARHIDYTLEAGGGVFDRPQVFALRESFELLRAGSPTRVEARARFDQVVVPAYPHASFNEFVRVLSYWGQLIHAPIGGPRRRVYPQQLVHDLLGAFRLAHTALPDGVLREIGLFSRMLQDVEAVYMSIDSTQRFRDILNFLQNVAETGYDISTDDLLRRPDAVTVSTVHKAKGLEFPVVFVVDVEAGRFPRSRGAYRGWLPPQMMQAALGRGAYQATMAEEARLFYTAMTRGERFLYITGSAQLPGGAKPRQRSRFWLRIQHQELAENPNELPPGLTPQAPVPRIDDNVMPTSYTEIRYYLLCPRDYLFRKIYGFSPSIPDLFGYGMTVHTAIGKLHELFPNQAPTPAEAEAVARDIFHLKHVPPSADPVNRPGAYEQAQRSAARIARDYTERYATDFSRERQVEARFELPVQGAVISGVIDLLLRYDEHDQVVEAQVLDFKTIEGGENALQNAQLRWTDLALQVQLYAKGAQDILGENIQIGAVHLLKDNQRINVPVDGPAVDAAVGNVEWAVQRITARDFPMRPHPDKCGSCDFRLLCPRNAEPFTVPVTPPPIHTPNGPQLIPAFGQFQP
jgi:DNA helicase-2/ATP-dependent DNA helicase PcrA